MNMMNMTPYIVLHCILDNKILIIMLIDYDSTKYNPSFLSDSIHNWNAEGFFKTSFDQFSQLVHEFSLPDDVVSSAVHRACDFMHIDDMPIRVTPLTGVFTNNPTTYFDDVFGFSREQMMDMGIHDENSFSLICTHEVAHCLLQFIHDTGQLSQWQTELSCDAFMGVRAIAEGLNISNVEDSLRNLAASSTHPDGSLRLHYIEIGKTIAQDLIDHDLPINVDNVLSRLNEFIKSDAGEIRKGENEMDSMSENESFQKFKPSYTDAEIIRMKSDVEHAETEVSRLKSDVNSWESKVSLNDTKEKRANGDYAHAVSKLNEAKSRYNHAVDELKNAKRKLNSAL